MQEVGVVGLGQLGQRHLEALLKARSIRTIHLVDPLPEARAAAMAITRAASVAEPIQAFAVSSPPELPPQLDFCVVATSSLERRQVLEALLGRSRIPHLLLEKFLFPRLEDYAAVSALLERSGSRAWVNCPRRTYSFYRSVREARQNAGSLSVTVSASRIQVGTHAIHFLDLFAFLAGITEFDHVDASGLHRRVYDSKRRGYIEFRGTLTARRGPHAFMFQTLDGGDWPLQVNVTADCGRFVVMENEGVVHCNRQGARLQTEPFPKPLQSDLTHVVVDQLRDRDDCDLTPYGESAALHQALLAPLLSHFSAITGRATDLCAIT